MTGFKPGVRSCHVMGPIFRSDSSPQVHYLFEMSVASFLCYSRCELDRILFQMSAEGWGG